MRELAGAFGISRARVRVIVPDTGSGYGGKHSGESGGGSRAAGQGRRQSGQAGLDARGRVHLGVLPPGGRDRGDERRQQGRRYHGVGFPQLQLRWFGDPAALHDSESAQSNFTAPFALRQGSYRALASTANHFAREVHVDELAHSPKMDPLEFRLKNLKDERLRAVLEAAAKKFGWGKAKPPRITASASPAASRRSGYVANCAEVAVDRASGKVQVVRVVTAFECGAVVNPDDLKNQVEGSVVQGIGGALFEAIRFRERQDSQPALFALPRAALQRHAEARNRPARPQRFAAGGRRRMPDRRAGAGGGAAIFQATGVRLRSLPMVPNGLKS